jgi:hypothetical protein
MPCPPRTMIHMFGFFGTSHPTLARGAQYLNPQIDLGPRPGRVRRSVLQELRSVSKSYGLRELRCPGREARVWSCTFCKGAGVGVAAEWDKTDAIGTVADAFRRLAPTPVGVLGRSFTAGWERS